MDEMMTRERFRAIMNFQPFDRLPVVEWCMWWDQTLDRWRRESLPKKLAGYDLQRHFGLDVWRQIGIGSGRIENVTIVEPVIRNIDEYEKLLPDLYPPTRRAVDRKTWRAAVKPQRRGEIIVWLTLDGPFWLQRILLGDQEQLLMYYDQPELIHRITADMQEYQLRVIDAVCEIVTPDLMTWAEDFSCKHGPLIGPAVFRRFNAPYYRAVSDRLHAHGVPCIVDTDGDPTISVPWFVDCGVDGLLPWEARAGCDVAAVREQFPKLLMIGGYDKTVMSRGEVAIRAEFERLLPTARTGGFIISCDHQTPPDVSLRDYKLFLRLFREYAAMAAS